MLGDIRDYIKALKIGDYHSIGKIDDSKDNSIGVYSDGSQLKHEAIGLKSSYRTAGVRILYHGTKNLKDTEAKAHELYEKLRYITCTQMNKTFVQYFDLSYDEPVFVGTDSNGVYEYVISAVVYYRKAGN